MATAVDAAVIEIRAALAKLEPELEGLTDFAALDLEQDAHAEIVASINEYQRREYLLRESLSALEALVGDGFPILAVRVIPQAAYQDLAANAATIQAALAKFEPSMASALGLTAGPVEPKETTTSKRTRA